MTRKYTTKKVEKIFADHGCELLSPKYETSKIKLDYRCCCGDISKISLSSFLQGNRCSECGNKKKGNNIKYTIEEVEKIFKDAGCELLSSEYVRSRDKLDYRCSCGNVSTVRLTHFLRGHKCKVCGHKRGSEKLRHTFEYVDQCFKDGGCILLETEYKNQQKLMRYVCNCGRESKISFSHFLNGKRCKKCGIEKNTGKNSSSYNHNLTDEDRIRSRKTPENRVWRKTIYKNNDYTCQKCLIRGGVLNAHHIESWDINEELRYDINNGITFCKSCHVDFHKKYGRGKNTREQLNKFLKLTTLL